MKVPTRRRGIVPDKASYRQWCRDVVLDETVLAKLKARAQEDADFALRLAEHGFGRAPQALQVSLESHEKKEFIYRVEIAGVGAVPPSVAGLPDARALVDGEG